VSPSKLKVLPEDFVVREEIDLPIKESGPHRVYLMEKRSWNTVDAIRSIARASGVSPSTIRYAGLKDRHALTYQHISVPRDMELVTGNPSVKLTFLGFSQNFVSTKVLSGNAFRVTLRSLSPEEAYAIRARTPEIEAYGFPNYYDDQRFGSVGTEGFFAERLLKGHLRGALRLHLTAVHSSDSASERERKYRIGQVWGKWDEVLRLCVTPEERAVAEALKKGGRRKDLLSGINAISASQTALYLSAYQSYLWNRVLGVVLRRYVDDKQFAVPGKVGDYTFYRGLSPEAFRRLRLLQIPTAARRVLPCEPEVKEAIEAVLEEAGIPRNAFTLRGVRNAYFHSFYRPAIVVPRDLVVGNVESDERYPGRGKVCLEFRLTAGSYATMFVKAMVGLAGNAGKSGEGDHEDDDAE